MNGVIIKATTTQARALLMGLKLRLRQFETGSLDYEEVEVMAKELESALRAANAGPRFEAKPAEVGEEGNRR